MEKITLILLLFVVQLYHTNAIRYEVTAPNVFRLGIPETVGISISDHAQPIEVEIFLQDSPGKTNVLSFQRLTVHPGTPEIRQLTFKPSDIPDLYKDDEVIFVYLSVKATKAEFPPKEMLIPVKKFAGYAFLQTDKPLYLPKDTVHIRVLHLNEKLLPSSESFVLEIKNPNGHRVLYKQMAPDAKGITETQFHFPVLPLLGNWSVSVHYGYQMTGRKTIHFDVKEYVLPTFSVTIEPPKFILDTQESILTKISAKYVYGKPVEGLLNVNYAIRNEEGIVIPVGTSQLNKLQAGEYYLSIDVERDIKQRGIVWFPHVLGSHLLIEAEVIEKATGVREKANDYSSVFTMSPYTIEFSRSSSDFKPGVPYQLQVDVKLSNGQGAPDVMVQILRAIAKKNGADDRLIPIPMPLKTDKLGRVMFKFGTINNDQQLEVTVGTQDDAFNDENQATNVATVESYKSPDQSTYVWIAVPGKETIFKVGSTFETDVTIYPPEEDIKLHYIVVARGTILLMAETERQKGALVRSIQFPITPEMSPSARLIVYIVRNNRIVADSLKIEVEEKCKYNDGKELEIDVHTPSGLFKPDQAITIKIKGEIESSVGILAVDKAVYILNEEHLLTREQLFHELTAQDFGCGPGGGVNTEKVFQNAGVVVLTNVQLDNHNRQECQAKKVAKRSIGPKVSDYSGVAAVCCRLGQLEGPPDLSCIERAEIIYEAIGDAENCSQAFLDCCEVIVEYAESYNALARSVLGKNNANANLGDLNIIEIKEADALKFTRWIFPETWLWGTYRLGGPECKGDDESICEIPASIPHSITTWSVQAVGLSQTTGMCVAKPKDVVVFRSMFIQMQLPYAAVRGEQIQLPVTIFNYDSKEITVSVYMIGVEGVCMGAGAGEKSEIQKVTIEGNGASTVTFPIMPLEVAEFPIKVIALSWSESDAIEKILKVVHEGIPTVMPFSLTLDPSGFIRTRRKRSLPAVGIEEIFDEQHNRQSLSIDLELPDNYIPETGRCQISLMGDVVGQVVTTSLQGLDKRFFHLPRGCGEQTMITFAPLVYTMIYLKRTDKLNAEFEKTGYSLMQQGYSHLLQYRKADGSFSVWTTSPSSIWLTAFVAKVLCQAESFIQIPEEVRCGAVEYIVQNQKLNGAFDSTSNVVHHTEMTGGIQGDVTTSAFILISMMLCDKCKVDTKIARTRAVAYLEENLDFLNQPYALAVVTYALVLAQSEIAAEANAKLKALSVFDDATDSRFWNWDPLEFNEAKKPWVFLHRPNALAVETTAYALLAQLQFDDILYSHPIANWLNRQRNEQGSFVSTQDSVMALQALAEYAFRAKLPSLDMQVNISSEISAKDKRTIVLNNANSLTLQQLEVPIGGKIHVDAAGVGIATMQVALHYNIAEDKEKKCKFDLDINTREYNENLMPALPRPEFDEDFNELPPHIVRKIISNEELKSKFNYNVDDDEDQSEEEERNRLDVHNPAEQSQHVIQLEICVRYLDDRPAGMSILEIGLFTGYKPVEEDLQALTNNKELPVTQYEPSDRSIIFYLDYVPEDKHICIKLRTYQVVSVGKVQPTTVKIFDYYEPDKSCTKFYKPDGGSQMMKPICEGKECRCVEGQCPQCFPFEEVKKLKSDAARRKRLLHLACDKHDFVWNGELKNKYEEDGFMYYEYLITHVLKAGLEKTKSLVQKRKLFTGRPACACPEMEIGNTYIIMGKDGFRFTTSDGEIGYKHLFDKRTSVYLSRPLNKIPDIEENDLQKAFNWLFRRTVDRGLGCDH